MKKLFLIGTIAVLLLISCVTANAGTYTWTASNGSWNTTTLWSPVGPPDGIDNTIASTNPSGGRTITMDGDHTIGNIAFTVNNNRSYTINSGTPSTSILTLQVSSGVPSVWVGAGSSSNYLLINAPLAGTQGFTKSGVGFFILGGVETLTGTINITGTGTGSASGGWLVDNGSLPVGAPIQVNNYGGLAGTGTILDAVTLNSGGKIDPGANVYAGPSVGTLTANSLTWNGGGSMTYELGQPVAGNSDILNLIGSLAKGTAGTYNFSFTQNAGFSTSSTYTLINFASQSGFSASDFGGAPAGMQFEVTDTSLLLETVPEPATWAMLLGGLGIIAAFRRRYC
jgi:PEP-CTERM motif